MKPRRDMRDGEMVWVHGQVFMAENKHTIEYKDITYVYESDSWPIIPVSVGTIDNGFYDVVNPPEDVKNWRKRGDLVLTQGRPKS